MKWGGKLNVKRRPKTKLVVMTADSLTCRWPFASHLLLPQNYRMGGRNICCYGNRYKMATDISMIGAHM